MPTWNLINFKDQMSVFLLILHQSPSFMYYVNTHTHIHFPLQNLTLRYCGYLLNAISELFLSRTLDCTNFKQHNHHVVQILILCLRPLLWTLACSLSLTQETTTSFTTCETRYSKNPLSIKWMKGKKISDLSWFVTVRKCVHWTKLTAFFSDLQFLKEKEDHGAQKNSPPSAVPPL